jgi:CRISPR/Cas system endoribonuclease Cas6 (RAMP superfamily)
MRFTLSGEKPEGPFAHTRALQALVYQWINEVNPEKANELHGKEQSRTKPFAIGPIMPGEGETFIFHILSVDDELARVICAGAYLHGMQVHLKAPAKVLTFTLGHDIVMEAQRSWKAMSQEAVCATAWRVRLLSPTACKIQGRVRPLPDPCTYFASWFHRWMTFAPETCPIKDVLGFVADRLDVTDFAGETVAVPISNGQLAYPGFLGTVDFSVSKPTREDRDSLRTLDTLIAFAEFTGTGTQTMRGMGQTRTDRLHTLTDNKKK